MKRLRKTTKRGSVSDTYCEACLARALEAEPLEDNESIEGFKQDEKYPHCCIDCGAS